MLADSGGGTAGGVVCGSRAVGDAGLSTVAGVSVGVGASVVPEDTSGFVNAIESSVGVLVGGAVDGVAGSAGLLGVSVAVPVNGSGCVLDELKGLELSGFGGVVGSVGDCCPSCGLSVGPANVCVSSVVGVTPVGEESEPG